MDVQTSVVDMPAEQPMGYVGRIPVRNLWLLMLYASELFETIGSGAVSIEENPDDLPELVAEILSHAVEERQRRCLSRAYQSRNAVLNRVRGRIDVLSTERHQLLARGAIACRYDELTIDTPRNRFVRGALEIISGLVKREKLAHRCRLLAGSLRSMGVSGCIPTRVQMTAERYGRSDARDRQMVSAAKLAFDLALPTELTGVHDLAHPKREEVWVRRLFEKAVGGFYSIALRSQGWAVRCGKTIDWQVQERTAGIDSILPTMRTDIVLDHTLTGRRIVIDTKFTSILTKGWHTNETLKSGYIYQIYAYLHSQAGHGDHFSDGAQGLLLHPAIGEMIDESVVIQGHRIRFSTVDLTAPATVIRNQLLRMCDLQVKSHDDSCIQA